MAGNTTKPDASMATPQSLQDVGSASISPLEMLIAALDPQKQQQQEDSIVAFPNADGSGGFGNGCCTGTANYAASMPWGNVDETATSACLQNAARRASDAVIFEGYQIGKPLSSNGSSGSDMVPQAEPLNRSMMLRKGSYPQQQGVKRPFSDFEHLLSAADLYANNQISGGAGNGFNAGSASAFSQAGGDHSGPPAAKHTRHDSLIDNSSNMASVAESTAAAAAAASFSYAPMAFPYSTRRSTVLGNYFDQLSPTAANPLMSESMATGVVNGQPQPYLGRHNAAYQQQQQQQPQHYRSLSLSHIDYPNPHGMMAPPPPPPPQYMASINMPHIPTSLQLASPLAPAPPPPASLSSSSVTAAAAAAAVAAGFGGGNPAMGYFYDGSMAMDGGLADGLGDATPGSIIFASAPIPAIPGVTVSPKEKPRRLSVPDLAPTRENDDGEEEEEEEGRGGPKARPRRQKVRFNDDMYTPMWVRGNGQQKEGFCDTCAAGKWLQLKNSAFWYHKQFFHGISSVSGRPFVRPLQVRHYDADIIEGLCHQCHQWVHIANAKRRNSVLWFRHAHKCHVYHKPKHDSNENKA
ncbi:hypothetical protein LPJ81_004560 [Coemansia sp. IMI 209127]|nr:hypothetical protein LPJ81_004560 [Coemansia sp. IMI 209127]